jgi:hypothetical protein
VLGCTEIGLLVKVRDYDVPLFDTTRLHALAAVDFALPEVPQLLYLTAPRERPAARRRWATTKTTRMGSEPTTASAISPDQLVP